MDSHRRNHLSLTRHDEEAGVGKCSSELRQVQLPSTNAETNTPRGASRDQWTPSLGNSALPALSPARVEVLATQIRETAQKDAEANAGVLRGWLRVGKG